jgi:hypothetical protein
VCGPAVISASGKFWYRFNKLHREDGPAIEHRNGLKEWWVYGVKKHDFLCNTNWIREGF